MSDWERILATKDDNEPVPNEFIEYVRIHSNDRFALCAKGWRDGGAISHRQKALLKFYYSLLCDLHAKYGGTIEFNGALIDWAVRHREGDWEVWYEAEQL